MRLVLRKETLTELADADLARVAGGTLRSEAQICVSKPSAEGPCEEDLSNMIAQCDSWFRPCISNTCTL